MVPVALGVQVARTAQAAPVDQAGTVAPEVLADHQQEQHANGRHGPLQVLAPTRAAPAESRRTLDNVRRVVLPVAQQVVGKLVP